MKKWLVPLLLGAVTVSVYAADVRRLISAGDINFGSGTFTDTAGQTLSRVSADNVPFSADNSVKVGILYNLALASDNGVLNYCLKSAGDNTFFWGECVAGGLNAIVITGGSIDNTPIGATAASTGAFTSLTLGAIDNTIFGYLSGVTSSIQDQIDAKQAVTSTLNDISDGTLANPLIFADDVSLKLGTDNDFLLRYKPADGTLVVSTSDNTALCTFTTAGGLSCTGEVTASLLSTTATDGERYFNAANSTAPNVGTETTGDCYYDNVALGFLCWDGDSWEGPAATSIPWDNVTSKPALAQVKDMVRPGYSADDNNIMLWKADVAQTLVSMDCITHGTDNVTIALYECDSAGNNCEDAGLTVTATSSGASDATVSNTIDADDWVRWYVSDIQGTPTTVSCRVKYTVAR